MYIAVISGDIIAYTSLSDSQKVLLEKKLKQLFKELEKDYDIFIRLIKGDYLEAVVKPEEALRIALLIKTYIKSLDFEINAEDSRSKHFKIYGIRLAIGVGTLDRFDTKKGIIDGEAIYRSGRLISTQHTHSKQKIHIKQSLFFSIENADLDMEMNAFFVLIDALLNQATARQSEVIYYKLKGLDENEIAKILKVSRSVINRQAISTSWYAINKAINFVEYSMKKLS